jgi:hypothetical protein
MMEKNQRSRMNCVVEKRRAEEIVDHQPHTVRLPFGVNLTTDPRYEHISGEKMAIYCESGKDQRSVETELTPHMHFCISESVATPNEHEVARYGNWVARPRFCFSTPSNVQILKTNRMHFTFTLILIN